MIRTLSQRSTAELSALFEEWQKDPAKLRILLHELEFRDRPKAIRLRERVEQTLKRGSRAPEVIPVQTELPISDQNCATQFPEPPKSRTAPGASLEKNESQQREQGETSHYTKFTLVQPRGVSGRPTPYRPEMLNDVRLNLSPSDPLVKRYRIALSEWIAEMKRQKSGCRQFTLEDGELVNTDGGSFSYQFEFAEDANLFEGAKVELLIDGRLVTGSATGVVDGRIIITVADDFGSEIRMCILRIDNTALIQALHDRDGTHLSGPGES